MLHCPLQPNEPNVNFYFPGYHCIVYFGYREIIERQRIIWVGLSDNLSRVYPRCFLVEADNLCREKWSGHLVKSETNAHILLHTARDAKMAEA